ncbi:TonB-dependent receptor [Maribellus luteus]|uniref:TonB-dependent receptor n=1 Tax=Maribellus luteus TaxID=2305463 RepID=A0A399T756_9BACT|nr:TonB-dependent receptor [Maribellus luteus]RIJ50854.1 TonB-dependent receptor [Maribellus luteus]
MKKKLLLLIFIFCGLAVFSQNTTINGKVISDEQEALVGVTVLEKGTTNGAVTNINGEYQITVNSPDAILVFSFIGFKVQEVPLNGNTRMDVTMVSDVTDIDEVVVVGFGTQKKENITGATSFVKMDEILKDRPIVNSAQALQGVSAGLQVVSTSGQPGSTGTSLNIRGMTSINGGSPLILVNNVPIDDINDINPRDIESVSVLKDAAASSIYGSRAAFGVILITTKTAQKNQPMKFEYSTTASLSQPMELLDKATTRQFVEALKEWGQYEYFAGQNVDKWIEYLDLYETDPGSLTYVKDPVTGENYPIIVDPSGQYYPLGESDIVGDFLNDFGYLTIHNFTMSGGNEKISFRINAGYSFEDGVMVTDKDKYEKFTTNALLNADLTERMKSSTQFNYRSSLQSQPQATYSEAVQLRMYDPTGHIDLLDPTGTLGLESSNILPFDSPGNVVRYSEPGYTNNDNLRIFQKLEYTIAKDLTLTGEYTFEKQFYKFSRVEEQTGFVSAFKFTENSTVQQRYENTRLFRSSSDDKYHGFNLYAKYKWIKGDHSLNFLGGYNREKKEYNGFSVNRKTLISVDQPSLNLALGEFDGSDNYYDWAVMGYFGRVNYNFEDKYFLEFNGRYDGSSSFAEGDRFVFLPSASAGWNIAHEPFMDGFEKLTLLKLRASWGEIGNQLVRSGGSRDYYPYIAGYEAYNPYWIDRDLNMRYTSFNPAQLVSGGFTWERVQTANLGMDISFFQNRLEANLDVYQRKTIGMLSAGIQLPGTLGTEAPKQNIADLKVQGWELELGWHDRKGNLRYGINLNLSNNRGEITKFLNEGMLINNYYVGQEVGEIWGYVTDGYYTVGDFVEGTLDAHLYGPDRQLKEGVTYIENAPVPLPGDVKYKDLNGDGIINSGNNTLITEYDEDGNMIPHTGPGDRKVIGNNSRKYQFGINGYAEFKGFDFSFVLSGVGKRDLNLSSDVIWPYPSEFDNIYKHQLDYWTPDNQDAFYPRIYGNPEGNTNSNYGRNRYTQTKYLSDGRYLKIQNITFGYTFPTQLLSKVGIEKLRLFVAGDNLYTFDKLPKGLDPDQSANGAYPFMRNYSVGLNLTF